MAKTVVGSFDSYEEAQRVVNDLSRSGFANSDISIVASNVRGEYKPDTTPTEGESTTGVAVGTGAITGGVVGGVAGLVAGLMGLTIPGVGPIIAAGPLAAALAGAGAGAIAGGLIGGLTHIGVPEEHANYYAEAVRRGGALVTVRAEDTDAERAAEIMRRHGAVDIDKRTAQWRESGWTGFDSTAEPYSVEQINRERSAYRSEGAALRTEPLPGTSDPGAYDAEFLIHYRAVYASTGDSYEDYAPAYRYGSTAGSDARYRGRDWNEVETDVRRDWERSYPEQKWDRFKDAVRHGWEKVTGKR